MHFPISTVSGGKENVNVKKKSKWTVSGGKEKVNVKKKSKWMAGL